MTATKKTPIILNKGQMSQNKDMYSRWGIKIPLVFSFVNAFVITLFGIIGTFFAQWFISFIDSVELPSIMYFWKENLKYLLGANIIFYIFMFILGMILFYSCLLMWNGHRTGVNLYAIGKSATLLLPILFFSLRGLAIGDIMIGVLFIAYYYLYMLRHLMTSPSQKTD